MSQRSIRDHFFLRKRPADNSADSSAKKRRTHLQNGRRIEPPGSHQGANDKHTVSAQRSKSVTNGDGFQQIDSLKQQSSVPAYKRYKGLVEQQSFKLTTEERGTPETAKDLVQGPESSIQSRKQSVSSKRKDIGHSVSSKCKDLDVPSWQWKTPCADDSDVKERQVLMTKSTDVYSKNSKLHTEIHTDDVGLPAHERYQHLVDGLELPHHYRVLAEKFRCVDTIVSLMKNRKETCTFTRLKGGVEQMCRRSFEKKNLGQMKTVCPSAYTFQQEKGLPYFHGDNEAKVEYQLTVDINVGTVDGVQSLEENNTKHAAADHRVSKCNFRTTTSSLLIARRRIFHEKLIEIVKRYHQNYLKSLKVNAPISEIKRWHPNFDLNGVPDIAVSPLPEPPITQSCTTAGDLLQDAKHKLTPKVVRALESANRKTVKKDVGRETSNTCLVEERLYPNLKPKKVHPGLKGVCSSLLERIREKETQMIEETLTRDPAVEQKLAMMSRLPEVCRVLRGTFVTERKSSLPWDIAIKKLRDSCSTGMSTVPAEEHLKLLIEVVPTWISLVTVRHTKYVKLDRKADLPDVLAKIREQEKAITCGNSTVKDS